MKESFWIIPKMSFRALSVVFKNPGSELGD